MKCVQAFFGLILSVTLASHSAPADFVRVTPDKPPSEQRQVNVDLAHAGSGRIQQKPDEFARQQYDQARHYGTLTLNVSSSAAARSSNKSTRQYTDLPQGITSFGAAIAGNWLYVYGGHFGRAHHYSNTSQSGKLSRLNLKKPGKWQVVAKGPRLQGLAMVAHRNKLYRIGGFTAHNEEDAEHDLRSVADVARFDLQTRQWENLTPLPEPRSSHDAVVIGEKLYVAGGWQLGGEDPKWHDTAWVADLSQAQQKLQWQPLPAPPFRRRALSLGHLNGDLYVIGGMQQTGGPTTRVDRCDLSRGKWSRAPSMIDPLGDQERGAGMEGFGSSAFTVGDRLYVSTYGGNLQVLEADADAWRIEKKLEDDRFFHRMLPFDGHLLLVGGASMTAGKRLHLETVPLPAGP